RQGAAIGEAEKSVAELDLVTRLSVLRFFAPGRHKGDTEQVLKEPPVGLVVLHHIGMMVQPFRQMLQQIRIMRGSRLYRVHPNLPSVPSCRRAFVCRAAKIGLRTAGRKPGTGGRKWIGRRS